MLKAASAVKKSVAQSAKRTHDLLGGGLLLGGHVPRGGSPASDGG